MPPICSRNVACPMKVAAIWSGRARAGGGNGGSTMRAGHAARWRVSIQRRKPPGRLALPWALRKRPRSTGAGDMRGRCYRGGRGRHNAVGGATLCPSPAPDVAILLLIRNKMVVRGPLAVRPDFLEVFVCRRRGTMCRPGGPRGLGGRCELGRLPAPRLWPSPHPGPLPAGGGRILLFRPGLSRAVAARPERPGRGRPERRFRAFAAGWKGSGLPPRWRLRSPRPAT